jgi:predicted small metal-binding protein
MKKLLSCREVWCYDDCDYIVSGETEEDVVISAAEHGITKHGRKEKDMAKLREKLRGFIYTISC